MTAQPAILSPSPSFQPISPTPDRKHDTLLNHHDAHNTHRLPPATQESPERDVRPGRLKRRKPPSRQSSPESVRSSSPGQSATKKAPRKQPGVHEKQSRDASTPPLTPSQSPHSRRKGKQPAASCTPSPSIDVDPDTASTRSASPDRSDDDPLTDDPSQPSTTHRPPVVPAAKQLEIDAVISRLPPPAPWIEADTNVNTEINDRLQIDEGFCDETLESHYQAFMEATEELRSRGRPYYRVRTPGAQKATALVQRSVVRKTIRMRRREPKSPAARGSASVASGSAVTSSSSAT